MLHIINLAIVLPLILLVLQGCSKTGSPGANTISEKPNIILIISDDQGYADLSVMDVLDDVSTQTSIVWLQGTFNPCIPSSPICNTSRCAIIRSLPAEIRHAVVWRARHIGMGPTLAEKKSRLHEWHVAKSLWFAQRSRNPKFSARARFRHLLRIRERPYSLFNTQSNGHRCFSMLPGRP